MFAEKAADPEHFYSSEYFWEICYYFFKICSNNVKIEEMFKVKDNQLPVNVVYIRLGDLITCVVVEG